MAGKQTANAPWQELEQQAYHAYREWPIWLALRERELAERLGAAQARRRTASATGAAQTSERQATVKGDSQ